MYCHGNVHGEMEAITRPKLVEIGQSVQQQCTSTAVQIIDELEKRFPAVEVMDALGVIYPQY
jgi:hypothetical protein